LKKNLQELLHAYWQVENGLHFVKDRWWNEVRFFCGTVCGVDERGDFGLEVVTGQRPILWACPERIPCNPTATIERLGFNNDLAILLSTGLYSLCYSFTILEVWLSWDFQSVAKVACAL